MPLILIRGLPGSGKTARAQRMIEDDEADTYYEADMWFDALGWFAPKYLKDAHEWCRLMAEIHHGAGHKVIISNTFTRKWEMEPYFKIDPAARVIECTGRFQNVHGVPEWKIEQMASRWEVL